MLRPFLVLALAGALTAPALALDPHRAASQYVVTRWAAAPLPSNAVYALLQTRDRYVWMGMTTGLVRFDGARFVTFTARSSPTFGDGGATRLAEGADGSLFVGTSAGTVLRHKDGAFTRLFVPPGTAHVSSLLAARDGSLWIGMFGQLLNRWHDGKVTAFPRDPISPQAPYAMVERAGAIWIGTRDRGLVSYRDGEFHFDGVTEDVIQAMHFDRAGALWIGTPHGLLRHRDGHTDAFTRRNGLSHENVTAILEDRDGNLWVGTAGGGLNRLTHGRWSRITTLEGLSDDDVRCLLEDHEGNLWVGTADGVSRLSNGRFVTYGRFEGLPEPAVTSVTGGGDGAVWIGTSTGGVARLRDGAIERFELPASVGREAVIALHEARDGRLWIALDNGRLFRLDGRAVSEHTPTAQLSSQRRVRGFFEDDEGMGFLVAIMGLARLQGRTLAPLDPPTRVFRYPHAITRDAQGTYWLSDLHGLGRGRDGAWTMLAMREGATGPQMSQNRVRWVSPEKDGTAWAATIGGLAYIAGDTVRRVTTAEGLPENYLRLVLDDGLGHLWIASPGYIFRLDKEELHALFAGRVKQVAPLLFDASDGLRTTEGLLANNPGYRGADGRLWFATAKGVSVVDPSQISTADPAPPVNIERITVDGRSERLAEYAPGRGEVTIEYGALSFRAPGRVRFRYRLEGFDRDWIDADTRRSAYYSNLPAGPYRFVATASNADGVWNGDRATLSFAIRPPFTATPLFYALCVLGVGALAGAAYRVRVGQMHARFAAIIGERTRIARELHDTLAQGLAAVAFQIETADESLDESTQAAREHMQMADAMVRSSLAEVRRSIWVLRAQTSRGDSGVAATLSENLSQLTADTDMESSVRVTGRPRALSMEVERHLLRIAHEVVTNAVRHAEAHRIAVEVEFADEGLRLRVADDGRGFDLEEKSRRRGDHFGLLGIEERVHAVGGELKVTTAPGRGTEIVCRLPYHSQGDPAETAAEDVEGTSL
jgi:signal transduction histidine kinase/ligand-binding sensor domain-containing protein